MKDSTEKIRPPIVTVLGHVDHGKTTLLDFIRNTKVATREAGGITQGIGASVVSTKDGKDITFIDTPGHAVFSKMRSSGANASDIAVLVVAANDGMKPQTKEALKYIKEADIPYIVAATKSDLPAANIDKIKSDLLAEGVQFDGEGGDVPLVAVSGKTGEGIEKLLDTIRLLWEVNATDSVESFSAFVIESIKGKQGFSASVVVKSGILEVGKTLFCRGKSFKVRGLTGSDMKPVKQIKMGYPAQIIGMTELLDVGLEITESEKESATDNLPHENKNLRVEEGELPIIIKAKTQGSLDAISTNIPENVVIVGKSVGDVNDSDIFAAKSFGALIVVFESKVSGEAKKLSATEKVEIQSFDIIYEVFEYLEKKVKQGQTEILGTAEILAEFPFDGKRVAGIKVSSGKIEKSHNLIVLRGEGEVGSTKITSLKREKKDVDSVTQGQEAGLIFDPYLDFEVGDMIVSFQSSRKRA